MSYRCNEHPDMLVAEHEGVKFCAVCNDELVKYINENFHDLIPQIFGDLPPYYIGIVESVISHCLEREPEDYIREYLALWFSKYHPGKQFNTRVLTVEIARTDNPLVFLPQEIQRKYGECIRCPIHSDGKHVEHLSAECIRVMLCVECIRAQAEVISKEGNLLELFPLGASASECCSIDRLCRRLPDLCRNSVAIAAISTVRDISPEEAYG